MATLLGFVDDGEVRADRLERRGAAVVALEELDPAKVRYVIGIGDSGDARGGRPSG